MECFESLLSWFERYFLLVKYFLLIQSMALIKSCVRLLRVFSIVPIILSFTNSSLYYEQRGNLDLVIFSNLFTRCILVSIIMNQCNNDEEIDDENATSIKFFGLKC